MIPPFPLSRSLFTAILCASIALACGAQLPFYTDDTGVTDQRVVHVEFFNEFDGLQSSQYPNLNQNTANLKVNYGLPHHLEFDVDVPFLNIHRAPGEAASAGPGDTNLGIKWRFLDTAEHSHRPSLAASFYTEFPTGNVSKELGSGLRDYALNTIAQQPLGQFTRLTANLGYLFAGNTSTGVIGVSTAHGHVFTAGLSLTHDFNDRLTLGAEAYGGLADADGLGKNQLQFLTGGSYNLHSGLAVTFAILGGKYEASPSIGGQLGFALDLPPFGHKHPPEAPQTTH